MKTIDKAYNIALENLRSNYTEIGINAGGTHFSDLWTRDCMYACLGALEVGDYTVVKKSLTTLFNHRSKDNQITLRIGAYNMLSKFLHVPYRVRDRYTEDKIQNTPVDSNSLFIIVYIKYVQATGDEFISKQDVRRILEWLYSQQNKNIEQITMLISEKAYGGWADSLKKNGAVLYSNVLLWYSEKLFMEHYNKELDAFPMSVSYKINKELWNGIYFSDFITNKGDVNDTFSTDGNMFAILTGLATKAQEKSIKKYLKLLLIDPYGAVMTRDMKYQKSLECPMFRMLGMGDYHNGVIWTWISALTAVALKDKKILMSLARRIVRDGGVYETYDGDKPLKRLVYKSEKCFAWSSGLFVWAYHQLEYGGNHVKH